MKNEESYESYKGYIIEILYGIALNIHNDNFDDEGTSIGVDIEQSIYKLQLLRGECR